VSAENVFSLLFAVSVLVAGAALAAALMGAVGRKAIGAAAAGVGALAIAAWVTFALEPDRSLAVAATGLTVCTLAILAAGVVTVVLARSRDAERRLTEAEKRLDEHVAELLQDRESELERTLARARSDSLSLLTEHERQLGEERRRTATEREREATAKLSDALAEIQRRVEVRLTAWTDDLERIQQALEARLTSLTQRHEQAIATVEVRMKQELDRLTADTDEQRTTLTRIRTEFEQAAETGVAAATAELEAHAGERRRALRELADRLQRREHELSARIENEETEAVRRIQGSFADIERRQIEQLGRVVERAAERFLELANQQFEVAARTAREGAAQRLARELDRAVQTFARDAQSSLGEELSRVAGTGTQRLDRRVSEVISALERQRDTFVAGLEQRLSQIELEFRDRLRAITEEAEAERGILEERLQALARRTDETETSSRR
jgi:hypothetical protein